MLFNSVFYLIFLPFVTIILFLVPGKFNDYRPIFQCLFLQFTDVLLLKLKGEIICSTIIIDRSSIMRCMRITSFLLMSKR